MKKLIVCLIFIPLISLGNEHGDLGVLKRSLNNAFPHAYKTSIDTTKSAPTKMIEIFELRFGDCSKDKTWNDCTNDRERIELIQKASSYIDQSTWWYGWSFFLPKNFQDVSPVKLSIAQFYDEGSNAPAWMFQIKNDGLYVENKLARPEISKLLIEKSNLVNKWHEIQIETLFSKKDNGKFNVWVDKKLAFSYAGITLKSDEYYLKYGLYRSFLSRWKKTTPIPTQNIYFSNVKKETTQKALLPAN